ncbi:MAG: AAA family ATPase [Clostridia bacterium]|nr:AAA family ATPase [Clostridia bacterium]
MSNLYIITGPAGVGKSSISKRIAQNRKKSVLIEGDDIYSQVIGGYVSAWKAENHLELFWKICFTNISIYLEAGFDVIFNYIITPEIFTQIKDKFKNYNTKFVVLLTDDATLLQRDQKRPENSKMNERCTILLNKFRNYNFGKDYFLDNSKLSIEETLNEIENNDKFII